MNAVLRIWNLEQGGAGAAGMTGVVRLVADRQPHYAIASDFTLVVDTN